MKHKYFRVIFLFLCCFWGVNGNAQVKVQINSGNPRYPFPQFLEYAYGDKHRLGNLGTKNAEGVVHAEMEQDIRDAYQIHANEFAYTGEEWAGIKYIWTPYKSAYDCTEADGYALLAAAYMADQVTFNGYWMCTHDKRRMKKKRYRNCTDNSPNYEYGDYALSDNGAENGNTAADGDVDVALALYVAYMQWGEFMRNEAGAIVNDACGTPISYKQEMIEVIRGLVARSTRFPTENPRRSNSGMIGFDGYPKGGDTWTEQTNWATQNPLVVDGVRIIPEFGGPSQQHIDYNAPAYYRQFYELLESMGGDPWEIEQFRRGEASSDWLIGQLIAKNPKAIPTAGWVDIVNNVPTFTNFNMGEDYRCSWRTISNYMWHGNPTYSWNPTTHQVIPGGNTHEYDAGVRMSAFLNAPARWNTAAGSKCVEYGDPKLPYGGPSTLNVQYDPMTGVTLSDFFVLNWQNGTGTFSAVAAEDYELMGLLYRQCAIEWDVTKTTDCYLGSTPNYMHGWMRQMGMMVVSGNYPGPGQMLPKANMKIYRAIEDSVTYCYTGDQIKFLLDYRNYGSVDAQNVKIVEKVPKDFVFISATNGGRYDAGTHTVTWEIGTVKGFQTGGLAATKGQVSYQLKAGNDASGRYCTTAEITCSNGYGWTSNEYPNFITATMQRNCVDVVARSLKIEKTINRTMVNSGNMATYTINFENSSEVGWIDGGRPRVNVAFANGVDGSRLQLMFRLFNDAIEPYINYGNYRFSYYISNPGLNCYQGSAGCPVGWGLQNEIYEGGDRTGVVVSHENIVPGRDNYGSWNQRISVQFAPLLVTTTMHVSRYFGGANCRVHKGGATPLRGVWALFPSDYSTVDWKNDWSWNATAGDDKGGLYYPVTPSWQKLDATGKSIEEPVTKWLTCGCTESSKSIPNILVEEYDGYVWRRILGTGPMPGRDVDNVEVRDTLPKGLTFGEFLNKCPLEDFGAKLRTAKTTDGRDIIIWTIPKMQVKQKGSIIFTATADFPSGKKCETADEDIINYAWIWGDKNSPVSDTAKITVTCAKVPEPIVPTTLKKTADKEKYEVGEPITYTIEYEQTHGSIVKDATTMPATDWKINQWSLSGGRLTSGSTQTGTAMFDYARGKNGYLEFECTPAVYAAFQVLLRDGSGSTIALQVKPLTTSQMELTCYVGGQVRQTTQTIVYGGGNPFTMRIDLNEDLLRVWVNKDTTNASIFSVDKLPVGVGYAGFKNGNMTGGDSHGGHSFSKIYTHFDYAYNLSIIDRKPAEIAFTTADRSGALQGDSIVWNLVSGKTNPIPFGEKYTVTWKGTVNACNESIINVAYAKLMGHADNAIMAQAVSGCGSTDLCATPPTATLSEHKSYCEGETVKPIEITFAGGKVPYTFSGVVSNVFTGEDMKTFTGNSGTQSIVNFSDVLPVADGVASSYIYELISFKDANGCVGTFDQYNWGQITTRTTYTAAIGGGKEYCFGEAINPIILYFDKGGALSYTIETTSNVDGVITKTNETIVEFAPQNMKKNITPSILPGAVGSYTCDIVSIIHEGCPVKLTENNGTIKINPTFQTEIAETGTELEYCAGSGGVTLSLIENFVGASYEWFKDDISLGVASETATTLTGAEAGDYYCKITLSNCTHTTNAVTVTSRAISLDLGEDKTACTGEKVTLDAGAGFDTYEWSTGEKSQTLTVERDGDYSVTVTKGDCSVSDTINVSFGSIKVEVNNEPSCSSVLLTATASAVGAAFEWTLNGETKTGSTLTLDNRTVSSDKGTVTVTATATCTSEPLEVAYEIPMLSVEIKGSPSVCPGGTTSLGAIPTSNETNPTFTYQWYKGNTPITGADKAILLDATPGNYRVTVKSQYCEEEATHTISEGSGEINGTLTINGEEIIGNPRIYGSCGEELTIKADYLSDNGTFKWSANPPDATLTTTSNTITVQPTVDTEYYLQFENQCTAYDTIRIKMKPQATLSVTETKECGKTTLTATPRETLFNAVYTWIVDGVEQSETGSKIEIVKTAEVKTSVRSNEYCQSEVVITNATIDALTVEIAKVNPVCRGQEVKLTASIQTSAIETPQYQWSHRPAGMNLPFAEISGATSNEYTNPALTENTEYRVTVTAGKCTVRQEQTVEILTANLSGTITADGNTVNSVNEKKIHKTCGMTPITLAATHTNTNETSFTWTAIPADNTMSANGKQLTIQPAANTTYIVQYENNCTLSDTIIVEVHPLVAYADWTEFAAPKCEGEKLTVSLTLDGYDENMPNSYIKWYKNGEELTQHTGKNSLVIGNSTKNDTGLYRYEVNNGICFSSQRLGDDTALLEVNLEVKPIVKFTVPQTEYTVMRGENATIRIADIQPNDAIITWNNGTTTLTSNPAIITNVTQDQTWTVTASGADYCETTAEVKIQVDAKPEISIAIKDDNSKICQGTAITLTADTTGTGKLLNPTDYKITWLEEKNGTFTQIGQNSTTLTIVPTVSTRYKAEVTYSSQQVSSTEVLVEVYAPASYTLTQSPKTCSGDEITVGIENLQPINATVKWDDDNTITSSDLTALQLTVKPEEGASKEYHFTIDQVGRCSERGKLTVGIQHPIVYKLSNDTIVCQGEKVELTARAPQGTAYQWTNENSGEKVGTSSKLEAAPKENTTYSVTMTSQGVCPPITETIMVEVAGLPEITEIRVVRVRDVEILTNPNAGRYPFLYKIDNEAYRETNILTARYYGKYTYTVQDANGCKTSRDYTITAPAIIPPLFFTPGSGDENDEWKVPELADAYPDAVITIFDRFGKKLVEIKASDGGWDGTYLGKPMPTTDYWYEIVVAEIDKIYIGHFTLLRK